MKNGVMASINQVIDYDTAAIVATDFGFDPRELEAAEIAVEPGERAPRAAEPEEAEDASLMVKRPPVVTILGHVESAKPTSPPRRQAASLSTSAPIALW
jgi:translation initiation factor IF-2